MKKKMVYVSIAMIVLGSVMVWRWADAKDTQMQRHIAEQVIRFHVVANSDDDEDQRVKLEIKSEIVAYLQDTLADVDNVDQAEARIKNELPQLEDMAKEVLCKEGYTYGARATLGECYFPVKEYGDLTFPAGTYQALTVDLGKAEGKNWWCVMYPTLCYVDGTYQRVPDESKERLESCLTSEEYESIVDDGDISYRSRILEWIRGIF